MHNRQTEIIAKKQGRRKSSKTIILKLLKIINKLLIQKVMNKWEIKDKITI